MQSQGGETAGHTAGGKEPKKSVVLAGKVLEKLDNDVWFDWKQIKCVFTAGGGFMADAYDLFIISLLTKLIGRVYYPDVTYFSPHQCDATNHPVTTYLGTTGTVTHKCGKNWAKLELYMNNTYGKGSWDSQLAIDHIPSDMPTNIDFALKSVALIGTLVGQLSFGYLGDMVGRKNMHAATMVIMIVAALCSGMSFGTTPDGVIGTLCMWRFLLGLGIGGNYPLSATVMSETATTKTRGTYVAAVFACQGLGYLMAGTVTIICSKIWEGHEGARDFLWRVCLSLGAIPPSFTLVTRMLQPETARYQLMVKGAVGEAAVQANLVDEPVPLHIKKPPMLWGPFMKKFGWQLFGCASTWFLLDIAFYSQNLFQSDVFTIAGWIPSAYTMTGIDEVYTISRAQLIIALGSTIPGYWVTVATVEWLGRIPIQVIGFVFMTLFMGILCGMYDELRTNQVNNFIALYALTFFFANWGPNSITYILPSELFPARFRSTAHGFCAAAGKAGAIVGAFGFAYLKDTPTANAGLQENLIISHFRWEFELCSQNALGVLTAINFLGLLCTYPIPEPKGRTLEDICEDLDDMSGMDGESNISMPPLKDIGKHETNNNADVAFVPQQSSAEHVPPFAPSSCVGSA